jgi:Spy/CpxP family protein refolding chaperone
MKKYILITAALFLASFAYTQSNKEEVDLVQAAFGMEKKAIVADFVQLSETQKDAFWELYDEYETKRKELGRERIDLLVQYAEQYMTMTSEQADDWTKKVMELQTKTDKLMATYYEKVKGVSDGIVATQFYQIEGYILSMIRMKILQEIPFIKKN